MRALVILLALAAPAYADKAPDIAKLLDDPSGATFAFAGNANYSGATGKQMAADLPTGHTAKNILGAYSANKKSYWASADLAVGDKIDGHASAVWDQSGGSWKLVAFSVVPTATGAQQQEANKKGLVPPAIKSSNGAGDEYFLTVFDGVFSESSTVADTLGKAKDVVLFGSAATERYTGPAAIKKALAGWKLAFHQRDGMVDGKTTGRLLWIATNFDARPVATPKAAPTPYRVFLVLQGDSDGNYALVHASFSAMTAQGWAKP